MNTGELIMKGTPLKPIKANPISISYDANQESVLVLCDDGSIWRRRLFTEEGELKSQWINIDWFEPE